MLTNHLSLAQAEMLQASIQKSPSLISGPEPENLHSFPQSTDSNAISPVHQTGHYCFLLHHF